MGEIKMDIFKTCGLIVIEFIFPGLWQGKPHQLTLQETLMSELNIDFDFLDVRIWVREGTWRWIPCLIRTAKKAKDPLSSLIKSDCNFTIETIDGLDDNRKVLDAMAVSA